MFSQNRPPPAANAAVPSDRSLPGWKRCFDLTGCAIALPFLLLAAGGMLIWLALVSPGPLFFKQQRVGLRGSRFLLFKFRTMRVDADVASHQAHFTDLIRAQRPMQKLDASRDARLIPGGWLSRYWAARGYPAGTP